MKKTINVWSFIFSFICLVLYLIISPGTIVTNVIGVHRLGIVLIITTITFVFGMIGFSGVHDWKSMIRSIITIVITLGLSIFLSFVIFFGSLLS